MDRKHLGACSELTACAWLLRLGFEVHRNVSQHGFADLIAICPTTRETFQIDVKTVTIKTLPSGKISKCYAQPSEEQITKSIIFLYVVDGECYVSHHAPQTFLNIMSESGFTHRIFKATENVL